MAASNIKLTSLMLLLLLLLLMLLLLSVGCWEMRDYVNRGSSVFPYRLYTWSNAAHLPGLSRPLEFECAQPTASSHAEELLARA